MSKNFNPIVVVVMISSKVLITSIKQKIHHHSYGLYPNSSLNLWNRSLFTSNNTLHKSTSIKGIQMCRRSMSMTSYSSEMSLVDESSSHIRQKPKRFIVSPTEGMGNVRAYYIAKQINVVPMFQKMYGKQRNWLENDSLIVSFPKSMMKQKDSPLSNSNSSELSEIPPPPPPEHGEISVHDGFAKTKTMELPPYAVFFDFGAVVFFNCEEVLQTESIAQVEQFCVGYLETGGSTGSDDFAIEIDSSLHTWSEFKDNRLVLQRLDVNNIRVIASVLGQSVALNHFEQVVDGLLQNFEKVNGDTTNVLGVSIHSSHTKLLFKMLRESNSVLAEVIVKLGLLDRTKLKDTVWKYEKYFKVWEGLREEFEIDARWDIMNTKTEYLQHNMRFLVELIHSHKGERLEWMIIILITAELLVSLYGLYIGQVH